MLKSSNSGENLYLYHTKNKICDTCNLKLSNSFESTSPFRTLNKMPNLNMEKRKKQMKLSSRRVFK